MTSEVPERDFWDTDNKKTGFLYYARYGKPRETALEILFIMVKIQRAQGGCLGTGSR